MEGEEMNKTADQLRYEELGVDHTYTPKHWTDAKMFLGQTESVDMEANIQKRMLKITEHARKMLQIKSQGTPAEDTASMFSGTP